MVGVWAFLPHLAAAEKTASRQVVLDALVAQHRWGDLRDALLSGPAEPFYHGAVAAAFNDAEQARRFFQSAITAAPTSEQAYQAHNILLGMYLRRGEHRRGLAEVDAMLRLKPDDTSDRAGRALVFALNESPDQSVVRRLPSHIQGRSTDGGNPTLPIQLNGHGVNYVIDGNANISAISESDARLTRLTFHALPANAVKMSGATGAETAYRVAVADSLKLGDIQLANVAFLVFPDEQQPWSEMRVGERGALGMSVLLALETCRWNHDGTVDAGFSGKSINLHGANLWFDGPNLITDVSFREMKLSMLFDSGADETELWPPFAAQFEQLLTESGSRDLKTVRGIGADLSVESKTLPEILLRVGGINTWLRPAHVLLKSTVPQSHWYHGRLGFDLLHQAQATKLDFGAMTLELQ